MFSDSEEQKITRIFFQIVPNATRSIQAYDSSKEHRPYYLIGLRKFERGNYNCIYIDIENITPWQLTTFNKRAIKELPNKSFIEQYGNITRVGFRYNK